MIVNHLDIVITLIAISSLIMIGIAGHLTLTFVERKVNAMSPAMEALTASIAALQASVNDLKARLAIPAPAPVVVTDDADAAAAQAVVDSMKTEVDSLVPAAG